MGKKLETGYFKMYLQSTNAAEQFGNREKCSMEG